MHDALIVGDLVIAADNSGAIGEKPADLVHVPYETVGYFSARVALMECLAAGGEPFVAVVQNFSSEAAWSKLCAGIETAAVEMRAVVTITGSTETNFSLEQSATGITVIGKKRAGMSQPVPNDTVFSVVGEPLVGHDVMAFPEKVASLASFRTIGNLPGVYAVQPVGSKGIAFELNKRFGVAGTCALPMETSAGPATCFIVAATKEAQQEIRQMGIPYTTIFTGRAGV